MIPGSSCLMVSTGAAQRQVEPCAAVHAAEPVGVKTRPSQREGAHRPDGRGFTRSRPGARLELRDGLPGPLKRYQ